MFLLRSLWDVGAAQHAEVVTVDVSDEIAVENWIFVAPLTNVARLLIFCHFKRFVTALQFFDFVFTSP